MTIIEDLISIPSVSNDHASCSQIIMYSSQVLNKRKISHNILKFANKEILLFGQQNLHQTNWLVNTHLDVVPAASNQFSLQTKNGKIWGRGACDTKWAASILLALETHVIALATTKGITFALVIDEEIGGASTKSMLNQMPNLKGTIFLEPTQEKIITQAKGIMQIQITAQGISCHGSRPWEGDNAIEKIMHGLTIFRIKNPSFTNESKDTTFNFSQITGGSAINQVPDSCTLFCDVRFNPQDSEESILHMIKACFVGCEIKAIKIESPIFCQHNTAIVKTLQQAMKQNDLNPLFGFDHGSSDARHGTKLGIPSIVFGIKGKGLHSDKEWGSIKSIKTISSIIKTWISLL